MTIHDLMNRSSGGLVRCDAVRRDDTSKFFVDMRAPAYEADDADRPDDAVVAVRYADRYEICLNHPNCPAADADSWAVRQRPTNDWVGAVLGGPDFGWAEALLRDRTSGGRPFQVP